MIVYHGTNQASATAVVSKVDVTLGGGELGRGFYAGENISLAASLAKGKFNSNGKVVKIDIDDTKYITLNIKTLHRKSYLIQFWKSLLKRKKTFSHLFNVDVVCSPFATVDFSYQYKFESLAAENVLNHDSNKQILQ
ncbi:MAG: DUF3990 domain-containing protein [Williamsia sp.]|nr:DUF3990 domain-containing protein [Williamsia sp.]